MTNPAKNHKANLDAALLGLSLDRAGEVPLHAQLTEALRGLILDGRAPSGTALPASRALAQDLGVSRVTTLAAYDQLLAEGYLEARRGAGTWVAPDLPPRPDSPAQAVGPEPAGPQPVPVFHPGLPDLAAFPHAQWARHLDAAWRHPDPALLDLPDPLGWPPLRAAIAAHLSAWRGLDAAPGQIVITSGASEALDLLARLLPTDSAVHVEAPCYGPVLDRLRAAGHVPVPLPTDADGLDTARLGRAAAAITTPSRNYPQGMTLPLARRLALLDWAAQGDRLVIEDDYDSEFRFEGTPLPALAALAPDRVAYVGSFSKLLTPSLRLGYIVLPPARVAALTALIRQAGPQASLLPQPALARFMERGDFATHLRRMRRLYGQRRRQLMAALASALPGIVIPRDIASGMHLVCDLGLGTPPDREVAAMARAAGLGLRALSTYPEAPATLSGLVLGFAAFPEAALDAGVARLASLLSQRVGTGASPR